MAKARQTNRQEAGGEIRGCKVVKAANKRPQLFVYDEIGPAWAGMVDAIDIVAALDEIGSDQDFDLRINSPGGVCDIGAAIYNLLREHEGSITVKVDGIAASAASIVMMAGDEIEIAANARVMIHEAWTFMAGNKRAFEKECAVLQGYDDAAIETYVARTGGDQKQITAWLEAETWFNADEAIEHGFADRKTSAAKNISLRVPKGRYKNAPKDCEEYEQTIEASIELAPPPMRPAATTSRRRGKSDESSAEAPEQSSGRSPGALRARVAAARARAGV
tara:strand:+ start:15086 stop:15916 length:831 start_codon:yes stop_codon:yes gene_type:complete